MIDILLPTYNGARFIIQQLDSIINQDYDDWRLIIRDDGSKDNTINIVYSYMNMYPDRIRLVEDKLGNIGTSGSNNELMKYVSSDYFMFCDQDDIWKQDKISKSLAKMRKLEEQFPHEPILVCSDATCIDEESREICHSFYESQKFQDVCDNVYKLLALNIVQGSTALMNAKVLEVVKCVPSFIFHDWWTAVICAYYGHVCYIHEALLLYRQHGNNVVGANCVGFKYIATKLLHIKRQWHMYSTMYKMLPFRPSVAKWIFYKIVLNIRRL